jgi:hypothetical protein
MFPVCCALRTNNSSRLLSSDVLTVIVGKGEHKQKISVHEALIMDCSEFFRKAMSGMYRSHRMPRYAMCSVYRHR